MAPHAAHGRGGPVGKGGRCPVTPEPLGTEPVAVLGEARPHRPWGLRRDPLPTNLPKH